MNGPLITYVSIPQSLAHGSQSSGRTAQPQARRLGHGIDRNMSGLELRLPLSSCLCPEPAFSPEGPQLKDIQPEINLNTHSWLILSYFWKEIC